MSLDVFLVIYYGAILILVGGAGFFFVWWEGRHIKNTAWLPAGTVLHREGIPVRLRERTLVETANGELLRRASGAPTP